MAKLRFKTAEDAEQVIELRHATNRFGRAAGNDVQLNHPTVSGTHCEVRLDCGKVSVADAGSTNGTFLEGTRINEAVLFPGQTLRLGDVELIVVDTEVPVNIPRFEIPGLEAGCS